MLYGAVDAEGNPWASVLEGEPGFAHSPEPGLLQLSSLPTADDPAQLTDGAAIGLGSNFTPGVATVSTVVGAAGIIERFSVTVQQSYGPQYIQLRQFRSVPLKIRQRDARSMTASWDDAARAMIAEADTFFVASYVDVEGERSVDVSHRGGQSGFVQVEGNRLTIPDFCRQSFFNTLGNLLANPKAGLLFIDFNSGDLLQLSGRTEIILEGPQVEAFKAPNVYGRSTWNM
jgi:predicted pyridoxine 5'-phosphate oxidase superfamily flavin-nucleotide-binding protein